MPISAIQGDKSSGSIVFHQVFALPSEGQNGSNTHGSTSHFSCEALRFADAALKDQRDFMAKAGALADPRSAV